MSEWNGKLINVLHLSTSPGLSQERRNQELERLLHIHLVDKEHKKWDENLYEAQFALVQ